MPTTLSRKTDHNYYTLYLQNDNKKTKKSKKVIFGDGQIIYTQHLHHFKKKQSQRKKKKQKNSF